MTGVKYTSAIVCHAIIDINKPRMQIMATFLHNLMEGLRGRERFLEQKLSDIIAKKKTEDPYMVKYEALRDELKTFQEKIVAFQESGKDYDEHFERKIKDEHQQLEIKIDTWSKSFDDTLKK